jgi:hypothetical protein
LLPNDISNLFLGSAAEVISPECRSVIRPIHSEKNKKKLGKIGSIYEIVMRAIDKKIQ